VNAGPMISRYKDIRIKARTRRTRKEEVVKLSSCQVVELSSCRVVKLSFSKSARSGFP
jgi:hypothetical protein